jgi:transmembrane 9 superfamily protein 2/4
MTPEMREKLNNLILEKRKRRGIFRKKQKSLMSILFPRVSPVEYDSNQPVTLWIDRVDSMRTLIPFEYYKLPMCPLITTAQNSGPFSSPFSKKNNFHHRKNLGERLQGHDRMMQAPIVPKVLHDERCTIICKKRLSRRDVAKLQRLVRQDYAVHMSLDGLPVYIQDEESGMASRGYPIGSKMTDDMYFLYNHLRFTIEVNNSDVDNQGSHRIVGFSVVPVSVDHKEFGTCEPDVDIDDDDTPIQNAVETLLKLDVKDDEDHLEVWFSYEIEWVFSETLWMDRWDVYLYGLSDDSVAHHMGVLNSFIVVVAVTIVFAVILVKALRKDLAVYNSIQSTFDDDGEDSSGWKLVHGDVFRPPSSNPMLLSTLVGTGAQIATSVTLTLLLLLFKILSPMRKGATLSSIMILYVCCGAVSGYVSARLYKFSGGKNWKLNTFYTATCFPGACMALFVILNILLSFYGAATSVSFWTLAMISLLWLCVAAPLVFLGSFFGYKRDVIDVPMRTNQIARVIPPQPLILRSVFTPVFVGALPFSSICLELYFILGAVWLHQVYYLMSYLFIAFVLVGVSCALLSTVMCYLRLTEQDHRWWWKAFAESASTGFWLFLYSIWYMLYVMNLSGFLTVMVYVTYMCIVSMAFALYCGAVGFLTTFYFTRKIYGAIKMD